MVSNATNLHRASDTTFVNTPALSSDPSRIANMTFAKEIQELSHEETPLDFVTNDFPEEYCE